MLEATAEPELTDEQLKQLLVGRAEDPRPGIELTPAFKDRLRDEVRQRRQAGGTKP